MFSLSGSDGRRNSMHKPILPHHSFTTLNRPSGSRPTLFSIPFAPCCEFPGAAWPSVCGLKPSRCLVVWLSLPLSISSFPALATCSCAATLSGGALKRRSTALLTVPRSVSPAPYTFPPQSACQRPVPCFRFRTMVISGERETHV